MSQTISCTNILDHIVHLSPPDSLEETATEFRRLGFNVVPGGSHTDGLTSNALVVFKDGVYLELICFNKPSPPPSHRWGTRDIGWIDSANAGTDDHLDEIISKRYGTQNDGQPLYLPSKKGGRITLPPHSRELKWAVTFANPAVSCGELPFFCQDLSPREWRVPSDPPSNLVHANGAIGIDYLEYITPSANLPAFLKQFTAVLGFDPTNLEQRYVWTLATLFRARGQDSRLIVRATDPTLEEEVKRGSGLYKVGILVDSQSGGDRDEPKWGRIEFIPL